MRQTPLTAGLRKLENVPNEDPKFYTFSLSQMSIDANANPSYISLYDFVNSYVGVHYGDEGRTNDCDFQDSVDTLTQQ